MTPTHLEFIIGKYYSIYSNDYNIEPKNIYLVTNVEFASLGTVIILTMENILTEDIVKITGEGFADYIYNERTEKDVSDFLNRYKTLN